MLLRPMPTPTDTLSFLQMRQEPVGPETATPPKLEAVDSRLLQADEEIPATLNDTWGWKTDDRHWKSADYLIYRLIDVVSKRGNYLLNIGPTGDGTIPMESAQRLRQVGRWLERHGEAIYGTKASPFSVNGQPWRMTTKPGLLVDPALRSDAPRGTIVLLARDGSPHGPHIRFSEFDHTVTGFAEKRDRLLWHPLFKKPGKWKVEVEYAADAHEAGDELRFEVGKKPIGAVVVSTDGMFRWMSLGTVEVQKDELAETSLSLPAPRKSPGLRVRGVRLTQ
jgi:hypothetical protein